ncbi:MAG: hypothetical protein ACREJO_13100 [Phycisphaerales bacterium]
MRPSPTFCPKRRLVPGLATLATLMALAGCTKPLLAPDEPRSQYDNYDKIRSQYQDQNTEDLYGRSKPNLRGRLLPKE